MPIDRKQHLVSEINEGVGYLREVIPEMLRTIETIAVLMRQLIRELDEEEPVSAPVKAAVREAAKLIPPDDDADPNELMRSEDVCELLGVKVSQLYHLIGKGDFPRSTQKEGRNVVWPRHVVEAWVRTRKDNPRTRVKKMSRTVVPVFPVLPPAADNGRDDDDDDDDLKGLND